MKFGSALPMLAFKQPSELRDYAQALEGAGYDYTTLSGHFLSTEPARYPERPQPLYVGPYHEPMVTFGYLAGATTRLQFMTSILILPAFPTAVIAKQAAELSILSGGRFTLGVAISWNPLEYEAMGADIHTRGRRLEEQIVLLRKFWTEPFVRFEGRYHKVEDVGLNRLPPQPIPIFMGSGTGEKVLRRVAHLADGWIPNGDPAEPIARLRGYLAEEQRDAAAFSFAGRLPAAGDDPAEWVAEAKRLQGLGVTHLAVGAPAGAPPAQALARLATVRKAVGEALGV